MSKLRWSLSPSANVIHLIKASLLGDGTVIVQKHGQTAYFVESHSVKQKDYIEKIAYWLGECSTGNLMSLVSGRKASMLRIHSRSYRELVGLRRNWYTDENTKHLPTDLNWIDDFAVAKWYMDDGSLQGLSNKTRVPTWSTHSFTQSDVQRLSELLLFQYGLPSTLDHVRNGQYLLRGRVGRGGDFADVFWHRIAPYVVPTMRYKLPEKFRDVTYVEYTVGRELNGQTNLSCA